jgi:hypothetical protein
MKDARPTKSILLFLAGTLVALTMGFTYSFDTSYPDGATQPVSILDDSDRLTKQAIQERENVDHYWPLTGTQVSAAAAGEHRKVQFYGVLAVKPVLAAGEVALYTKTVSGKSELFFENEDGTETQLTDAGLLNVVRLTGNQTITGDKTFASILAGANLDIGDYELRAQTFESDVATGTAPLAVASTTKVTNLNADQVDGLSLAKYDSGWFAATVTTVYTKAHALGAVPTIVQVFYSDASDGSGAVTLVGSGMTSSIYGNNMQVIDMDATNVVIRAQNYLTQYYDAAGAIKNPTNGYIKIVALLIQ